MLKPCTVSRSRYLPWLACSFSPQTVINKTRQEKCQSLFFFPRPRHRQLQRESKVVFSLSFFDNCTTIEKMLEHWTNIFNGIAKGSKRNFLLCKWILGDRDSKCQFQIVSRRSKARQGGVFRIESVFSIFHSFLIPSIIFPVSSHRWMYT